MSPIYPDLSHPLAAPLSCLAPVPIWLVAAALDSDVVAALAACLGLLLGAKWFTALLTNPKQMLGFLKVGAVSLLVIMSLSWLIALFFSLTALDQSLTEVLEQEVGTTLAAYAAAVAFALVFAAMLGWLGNLAFIRTLEAYAVARLLAARTVNTSRLLALIVLICAIESLLFLAGIISYRTYLVAGYEDGQIAWFIPMLEIMFAAHIGLNALAISKVAKQDTRTWASVAILAGSVLLVMLVYFTTGRSGFILCALLHGYWIVFFMERIPRLNKLVPVVLIALPLLYMGTLLNNFMRSGNDELIDIKSTGFGTVFSGVIQTWQADSSLRKFEEARSAENLASRPLVAHPLAKSMALPINKKNFLLGENLFNSAVWAMPSVIFSDKSRYPIQEDLLYANFPVGTEDTADSPYLYAYVDFGYMGLLVYPMILAGFWVAALLLIRIPVISSLGVIVIVCTWIPFFTLSIGEAAMTGWFTTLRNSVIVIPFVIALAHAFEFPRGNIEP